MLGISGVGRRCSGVAAVVALAGTLAAPAVGGHNGSPPGRTSDATTGNENGATITHDNQYHCISVGAPGDPSPSGPPIGWPWVGAIGPNYDC